MDGALMEIGPYRVRKGGKLEYSDGSWDEFANLLFVDNPVGTGFSYVDTDSFIHELDTMASQLITFLEKWFALFPQYLNDDVSKEAIQKSVFSNVSLDIYRRRIICRSVHSILLKGNTGPK